MDVRQRKVKNPGRGASALIYSRLVPSEHTEPRAGQKASLSENPAPERTGAACPPLS